MLLFLLPMAFCHGIFLVFVLLNVGGLLQTFTRSLWVVLAASVVLMLPLLSWKKRITLTIGTIAVIATTYFAAYTYNPKLTAIATKIASKRVTTSAQFKGGDRSFETRVIEAEQAWRWIRVHPLGGNGLRAPIVSWDPIVQHHSSHAFIHIGYLSLMFKFGIPLSIVVIVVLGAYSLRSLRLGWRHRHGSSASPVIRATALGLFAFVPSLAVVIFVAGFIDQRYGIAILAVFFALATICSDLTQPTQTELDKEPEALLASEVKHE